RHTISTRDWSSDVCSSDLPPHPRCRAGTGLDNVDVAAAKERGIAVLSTPAANAVSVAELVIALMLALERHLVPAAADLRRGRWEIGSASCRVTRELGELGA